MKLFQVNHVDLLLVFDLPPGQLPVGKLDQHVEQGPQVVVATWQVFHIVHFVHFLCHLQDNFISLLLLLTHLLVLVRVDRGISDRSSEPCSCSGWPDLSKIIMFLFWFLKIENCKKIFIPPLRWHWCTDGQGQSRACRSVASSATFFIVKYLHCSDIYHAMVRNISIKLLQHMHVMVEYVFSSSLHPLIYLRSSAHGEVAWFHISGGNKIRFVIKVVVIIIIIINP